MPIENERKYVLRLNTSEKKISEASDFMEDIEQVYIMVGKKQSARIRLIRLFRPDNWVEFKYTFTYKQDVGKKTVEVETPLDPQDYLMLKKDAILKFRKRRYKIGGWEIDFFIDGAPGEICKTYFVQAEIELPEHRRKPKEIHPLVKENLLHAVKRGDGRFSSKKLGDMKYARRLLQSLLLETKV